MTRVKLNGPINKFRGLKGLEGLSSAEYDSWRKAQVAAGKITRRTTFSQEKILYDNQQYIAKYGLEEFESKSYKERMAQWKYDIVEPIFYKAYNPFFEDDETKRGVNGELYDPNKGMGADFFKYDRMTPEAKAELLKSEWLTKSEIDRLIKEKQDNFYHTATNPTYAGTEAGASATVAYYMVGKDVEETLDRGLNDKIIEKIWADDIKKQADALYPIVNQYYDEVISKLSDDEVNKAFVEAINGGEDGPAYIHSAYFDKNGHSSEEETENFSIDYKRVFLAEKAVYDTYLGPEVGYDVLNNQGKEYISDNQSTIKYLNLLRKDIGIGIASYTADKWNSLRRATLINENADVYITNDGQVVPTKDVSVNDQGQAFYESNGEKIPVHEQTLSLIALDDLGKDENGEDRGWFNNAQFWTNAEQFGTLNKDEIDKYKKLGYSPYKVVYKPGDETDIFYEAGKMLSFGIADVIATSVPVGVSAAGKVVSTAAKGASIAAKAARVAGKGLYYIGEGTKRVLPVVSATGIGNAYGRGVFAESYIGNLQHLEQNVADQAQIEIYNSYNTDAQYKARIDAEIEQEYQELVQQRKEQINSGQVLIVDPEADDVALKTKATQTVLNREASNWVNDFKGTDAYGDALQEAAESASTGAFAASLTTAAKYTAVNYGWRKFLFKTPAELANSYKKGAVMGVEEAVNSAGKKRLTSRFDFATTSSRAREFAKAAGSGFWGGAWTNATDELQSGGGRRINEDRFNQYIQGLYNGKAKETEYSAFDYFMSYISGASSTLATENPWRAGLVGGLGSIGSAAPNLTSLLATKNFKQTWKKATFGEKVNMLMSNSVLSKYYAKKQSQMQIKGVVDFVNELLDNTNDFEDINQVIALDMALVDATNAEDINTLTYLKAIQSIDMLNKFKEDKEAAKVGRMSTVLERAMNTIDKLSDPSKLSDSEKADFLSQYYAENPSIPQSEAQNEIALLEMQQRATRLQEAAKTYNEVQETLNQIEESRGESLSNDVRSRLTLRLALDNFLTDRRDQLEERISDTRLPSDTESILASYGTTEHQKSEITALEKLIKDIESRISTAEKDVNTAQENLDKYNSKPQEDPGLTKRKELQTALDNAKIQAEYLYNIRRGLRTKLEKFEEQTEHTIDAEGNITRTFKDRVLTADEILRLNPQDRARMLDKDNYNNYSDAQKVEIDKLRDKLLIKDPNILDAVKEQAAVTQRIGANRRAYSMMVENPEAAAYQLESDRAMQDLEAKAFHSDRVTTIMQDYIDKIHKEAKDRGYTISQTWEIIYRNLRKLNGNLLREMLDIEDFHYMNNVLNKAIEWSDMTSDISDIVESMKLEDNQKKALSSSLDAILEKSKSRTEVLDELGKIIESKEVDSSVKSQYENILDKLEELWHQRSSTTTMTKEERQALKEEQQRKTEEEAQRNKNAEKDAESKSEAENRTTKTDNTDINEKDTNEDRNKGEREAVERAAQGLTDKDMTTDNESSLTPEETTQAVAEAVDANLESPTLEEQAAAQPDKVDIIPAPKVDSTDQGNILPNNNDVLLGNSMYGYEINPLKFNGKQVPRRGASPTDKMSKYFAWMAAAGIKLQDIIDTELGNIMKLNPDVYPMFVKNDKNATNDDAMVDFVLLTVEYTQDVANIHNNDNGGVITSNGKQYLVIGTLGFARNNKVQGDMVRGILNSGQKSWFDAHPSERFFVDTSKHTQIQDITSGRLVRQLATDSEVQIRSISELLADKERNPDGLTMGDLKWGIQYGDRLATVNVSERNIVYPPSDSVSNLGSVFLLVETANGNYIPAYIRPLRLSELNDGKLKTQLNNLINELTSTEYARRRASKNQLVQLLNLTQKGDNIYIGTQDEPTVSIVKGGTIIRTFNLADANFDRTRLLEYITELNPRVNITTSTLSDVTLLEMFDEAGALTTDLAKLRTSNASYNVYAIDADGNPIITASVENQVPTLDARSDLSKAQRKENSEKVDNATYRRDANGNWRTETDKPVTDPRLIEQLNYKNLIRTRNLKPDKVVGIDEMFIINSDKSDPFVLIRRRGNQIFAMSREGALIIIDEVNAELTEKARQERLQNELEEMEKNEESNDDVIRNMSEEDKQRAATEGEDVDSGLDEVLTDNQIVNQMTGNFETEATPQQETSQQEIIETKPVESNSGVWSKAIELGLLQEGEVPSGVIAFNSSDERDGKFLTPLQQKLILRRVEQVLSKPNSTKTDLHDAIVSTIHKTKANITALDFLYKAQELVQSGQMTINEFLGMVNELMYKEIQIQDTSTTSSEPVRTGEDINKTGTKSLAELQSNKTADTAISIIRSREFGRRARTLLRTKFPEMPDSMAELENFLQNKGIKTTGITDVEGWLKMIEECK